MNFPLYVILARFVIAVFGAIAVWGVVTVLRATWLTKTQRLLEISGIVLAAALLIAWMLFWPAYWD